jgi:hypothetical protein
VAAPCIDRFCCSMALLLRHSAQWVQGLTLESVGVGAAMSRCIARVRWGQPTTTDVPRTGMPARKGIRAFGASELVCLTR